MKAVPSHCRACGSALTSDAEKCPVCRVPVGGDVNRRALAAYGFFLFVMLTGGVTVYFLLRQMFRGIF